jgi:autotransporter-associated beta strand protein
MANPYSLDMGSNRFNTVLVNRSTSGPADYSLGTLKLGASTMTFHRGSNISGSAVLRFSTLDLSAGNNDRPVILNGNATLRIGNAAILSNTSISKRLQLDGTATDNTLGPLANGPGAGILSVIKAGSGTWTLTGANTHTGTTTVQAGSLVLETPTLPDAAAVSIQSSAALHLAFAGTDIIGSLILNGTTQSAGTWGSLTSSAAKRSALITGPGTLTILPASYIAWANANGLPASATARALASDPDQDGIANCLEWALGGHPMQNSTQSLPKLTPAAGGRVFSFTRDPAFRASVPLSADWSTDLLVWQRIPIGATSSGPNSDGISVTITPVVGSPDQVVLTIPNGTTTGNLYLRLAAEIP